MRIPFINRLLTLTLGVGLMASAWSADVSLKKEEVPPKVLATMEKAANGNALIDYEKETNKKDGKVIYTANFKDKAGKEMEVEVNPDGTLIKVAAE